MIMEYLFTQLFNGLSLGSIYALVALGYSMVYGIVKLINFAHGDIIMIGSYFLYTLLKELKVPLPLALAIPLSIVGCAIVGLLTHKIAYERMLKKNVPRITLLITAIGISLFFQNLFQLRYGSSSKTLPPLFNLPTLHLGAIPIDSSTFLTIIVSVIVMVLLQFLVNKTKIGKSMKATSQDMQAAELMGINTNKIIAFSFAIGSALACVGAVLYSNKYPSIRPTMGSMLGLKAFVAAVLGGIGNIPGAMLGGFILGVTESLTNAYISTAFVDAIVFGILIISLLFKPAGLLGKEVKEKV